MERTEHQSTKQGFFVVGIWMLEFRNINALPEDMPSLYATEKTTVLEGVAEFWHTSPIVPVGCLTRLAETRLMVKKIGASAHRAGPPDEINIWVWVDHEGHHNLLFRINQGKSDNFWQTSHFMLLNLDIIEFRKSLKQSFMFCRYLAQYLCQAAEMCHVFAHGNVHICGLRHLAWQFTALKQENIVTFYALAEIIGYFSGDFMAWPLL